MTTHNTDFTHSRRQQFLTEAYYQENKHWIEHNIKWLYEQDWTKESDQYNCGEGSRWYQISRMTWELLQLEYTAGRPIEELGNYLEQVIIARENQARAKAEYFKTGQESVIGDADEGYLLPLQLIGLAYLLGRRDLLPRIETLIHGVADGRDANDDFTYEKLLSFNNPKQIIPNNRFTDDYINLENVFFEDNTPTEALADLTAYLKEWYLLHEDHLWHDSHLDLQNNDKYVGYWSFESAAVVYLLDLDDSSLHQFLYYPKDLVAYARTKQPPASATTNRYTGRTLRVGETCTSTGWYEALHLNNRREHFTVGQVIEGEPISAHGQPIVWYELTPEAAQQYLKR